VRRVVGWGGKNGEALGRMEGWGPSWAGRTGSFTIIELITIALPVIPVASSSSFSVSSLSSALSVGSTACCRTYTYVKYVDYIIGATTKLRDKKISQ